MNPVGVTKITKTITAEFTARVIVFFVTIRAKMPIGTLIVLRKSKSFHKMQHKNTRSSKNVIDTRWLKPPLWDNYAP